VLITVVTFSLIIITVGLAFMSSGAEEARNSQQRLNSAKAFWLAEAAYERLTAENWNDASWVNTHRTFTDTLSGTSYTISTRDTTINSSPAFHVTTWGSVNGVNANSQRRVDIAMQTALAAYTNHAAVAGQSVNFQSSTSKSNTVGYVHADSVVTGAGTPLPSGWTQGFELNAPALYVTPADSLGTSSQTTYYYVKCVSTGSPKGKILDRNGNYLGRDVSPAPTLSGSTWTFAFMGDDFLWSGQFLPNTGTSAVVVNFGEYQTCDLSFQGGASIATTIVNTRYTGPATVAARFTPSNWTGGTTTIKDGVVFEPANGLALVAKSIVKTAGGSVSQIGTATYPALIYTTGNVDGTNGSILCTGTTVALGSITVGGNATLSYNGGYASRLPNSLSSRTAAGATASSTLLSWKEIARQ
jgi:Tfp pilus assembly protein PilV